ncbi:MAG: TonB-dependent receptor [Mangrovibacterium sp.]
MGITKLLIVQLFLSISITVSAQQGTIKGMVIDKKTNEPLVGATILLDGTTTGIMTDFDGNYQIENINPGTYTIRCSFISYETIFREKVTIGPDKVLELNFELGESTVEIEDVKVVAKANRESESMLLLDQKDAVISRESIGARQLSTQGVSDAASAATKITGITKQEGTKTLNIRGLGDRYNTTTLNGLPLPSNDVENKNIDLELFATDVIEYIGVEKIFGAGMQGDFAGANINIVSKKHYGDDFFRVGLKSGLNSQAMKADKFLLADGAGYFGFYNESAPASMSDYDVFKNHWNPQEEKVYPHSGLSLSGGKNFNFKNSSLSAFATLSFENEYKYSNIIEGKYDVDGRAIKEFNGDQYNYLTQSTGLLNLTYSGSKSSYSFNSVLMNTSDESLKNLRGFVRDVAENDGLVRRSEFVRTTALVNQILGEHRVTDKMNLNWGVAYNHILNVIPDRRHNTLNHENDNEPNTFYFATNDDANNNRYFHELKENEYAANISLDYQFGKSVNNQPSRGKLTVGYSAKYKERSFTATQFLHEIVTNRPLNAEGTNIDDYFNDGNLQAGIFRLKTYSAYDFIIPSTYEAEQTINAGFTSVDYNLTDKFLISAGVRLENVSQKIKFSTTIRSGEKNFTELNAFPSLAFKYALSDKTNLRLSSGLTYTLPQFKETAPFLFEGTTDATVGNEFMYPSKDYSVDLKWEYFPKSDELFSAAFFGKYIADPMNKFVTASSTNDFSYANTGDWAKLYGLELEARKNLVSSNNGKLSKKLFLQSNMTLMHTRQELDNEKIQEETDYVYADFNKNHEVLQGAAPFIANTVLSYQMAWGENRCSVTPAMVYNYTSDRLFLIGYSTIPNQVDKAFHSLDFVLTSRLKKFGLNFSAKNLLNPSIDRVQENTSGDKIVRSYSNGIKLSFGFTYEL